MDRLDRLQAERDAAVADGRNAEAEKLGAAIEQTTLLLNAAKATATDLGGQV
jgi:hypothetical protein